MRPLLAIITSLLPHAVSAAPAQPSLEQAVKASYVFKFAPFIEWPARKLPPPGGPFTICLSGQDPFGTAMDDVVRGRRIAGHPIALRRLASSDNVLDCHVIFIGRPTQTGAPVTSYTDGQPILTITDKSSGVSGGMIEFVMQGGRVRFQIDEGAAKANGLTISSKLLDLAIAVDR